MIKILAILGALVALGSAYPQLRNSYGLPVQTVNQYDAPQVIIPSTSYGAPIAPSPTYGVPTNYPVPIVKIPIRNSYSFVIPQQEPAPASVYGPPAVVYDAPAPIYGAPVPVVYDVPTAPVQVYGPPPTTTPAPAPAPPAVYGPPPTPAQVYGPPPTTTTTTTTTPAPVVPAVVYGPPADEYGPPAPAQTYGAPAVPAEQVRAPVQTITYIIPQAAPAPSNGLISSTSASASAGTPPATAGVHSAPSGAVGQVFLSSGVATLPGVVQPPPPPAAFISGPAMKSTNTVFCI